jgi:hypothetical protein
MLPLLNNVLLGVFCDRALRFLGRAGVLCLLQSSISDALGSKRFMLLFLVPSGGKERLSPINNTLLEIPCTVQLAS